MIHLETAHLAVTDMGRSSKAAFATLLAACIVLSSSASAQSDDAAYCAELGRLALRYTGSAGGEGRLSPDFATLGAMDDCRKGNFSAGIPVLERKLRSNGFTLPKR